MFDKSIPVKLYNLSCYFLGISVSLVYSLANFDVYVILRYMGLGSMDAQGVWYFFRRFNQIISILTTLLVLFFGSADRRSVRMWNWILFLLYTLLLFRLYPNLNSRGTLTTEFQWILFAISVVSGVLQCLSVFYIYDQNAPGKSRNSTYRLALYMLGYCTSGSLVRLFGYYNTPIDSIYLMGTDAILSLMISIVLVYTVLTFLSSLIMTALIRYHWEAPYVEYLPLSVGRTISLLVHYKEWEMLLYTSLGWVMAPFCGLVLSLVIFRVAMAKNTSMVSSQSCLFCIYPLLITIFRPLQTTNKDEDIEENLLKMILNTNFDISNSKPAETNNGLRCSPVDEDSTTPIRVRLLRDTQPWTLLPYGPWTSWCDYDSEDHKNMLHCLGIYFKLAQIKGVITGQDCTSQGDSTEISIGAMDSQYALLSEVRCSLLWALSCYVSRYEKVHRSVGKIIAGPPQYTRRGCRFEMLACSVQACIGCQPAEPHYQCEHCVYTTKDLLSSTMLVIQGSILSSVNKAKNLCNSVGALYGHDKYSGPNKSLMATTLKVENILEKLIYLLLVGMMMEEWLLLCQVMETIDRHLVMILHRLCTIRNERHKHVKHCPRDDCTTCSPGKANNDQKSPKSSSEVTKNAPQEEEIASESCGCKLARKLFECAVKLHKKQCDIAQLILEKGCTSIDVFMPTLSHIRAAALLITNYLHLTESSSNNKEPCSTCKNTENNCSSTCCRYSGQLDELLDDLMSGMDTLENGDKILHITVSLVSCTRRNRLKREMRTPAKVATLGKKVLYTLFGSYNALWEVVETLFGKASFKYKNQHCSCKENNCDCCKGSDKKLPCCQCEKLLNEKKPCSECKNEGCFEEVASKETKQTCQNSNNCLCFCPPSDSNITKVDCNTCRISTTSSPAPANCEKATAMGIIQRLCCLTTGVGACWILFIKSLYCKEKNKSIINNLCNFKAYITSLQSCTKSGTASATSRCCKQTGAQNECVNSNACLLVKALFCKDDKHKCQGSSSKSTTCASNCIGCTVCECSDGPINHTCDGNGNCMKIKDIFCKLQCVSSSFNAIKGSLNAICECISSIKGHISCICSLGAHFIECCRKIYLSFYELIRCYKGRTMHLRGLLSAVEKRQTDNMKQLQKAVDISQRKLQTLQARQVNLNKVFDDQFKNMKENSKLMSQVKRYTTKIHDQVSKMSEFVDSSRRSVYLDSVKDVLFRTKSAAKEQKTEPADDAWKIYYLTFYIIWIFWVIGEGMIIEFLPYFGTITEHDIYKTLGCILSFASSYLLITGLFSLAGLPRQAGYLINVVILVGTAMTVCLSWVAQGYAYRSFMVEQFNFYYTGYRKVYPEYINPRWSSLSSFYGGTLSLVLADLKGLHDFLCLKNMIYNSDPYNMGFSSHFQAYTLPPREFMFNWTEQYARHNMKSALKGGLEKNKEFFDYLCFTNAPMNALQFVTDVTGEDEFQYPVDLMWNAWTSGILVTKGHYEVYDARIEALSEMSQEIISKIKEHKLHASAMEKKLFSFQKLQFSEMAAKCIGLSFQPTPARFSYQRRQMIDLFVEYYYMRWNQEEEEADTSADKDTPFNVEELSQKLTQWKLHKLDLCRTVYDKHDHCAAVVSHLAANFGAFLTTLPPKAEYDSLSTLATLYEQYKKSCAYIAFAVLPGISDGNQTSSSLPIRSFNSQLEEVYRIGEGLKHSKKLYDAENSTITTYLLGEWIKLQSISISKFTIKVISQNPSS